MAGQNSVMTLNLTADRDRFSSRIDRSRCSGKRRNS